MIWIFSASLLFDRKVLGSNLEMDPTSALTLRLILLDISAFHKNDCPLQLLVFLLSETGVRLVIEWINMERVGG